jgi:1-phosphatidylinositol-4-phosphate 5-kinase
LDFNKNDERVYVGKKRQIILEQINKDIEFLYRINSNDYSLLLGIHFVKDIEKYNFSIATTCRTGENKNESNISHYSKSDMYSHTYDTESNTSSEKSVIKRINKLKSIYDFEDGGILSEDKDRIYYFGIIDILTEFNTKKNFEYCFKRIRYCSDNMSCVPPIYYKQRFYNYLQLVFPEKMKNNRETKLNFITNNINNLTNKGINVDKYGAISSSKYKQYQKEEIEREKFTMEDSLQKF